MYKITNNINQLTEINNAVKVIENNQDSQYAEFDYNVDNTLIAIPITDYLRNNEQLKSICPFLDNDWFNDIQEKPDNWTWHFDTSIRIIIPNYLILKEAYLKALINYCDANEVLNFVGSNDSYIYVNEIYPEHQAIFDMYNEIKIETK